MDILQWKDNAERLAHALLDNIKLHIETHNSKDVNKEVIRVSLSEEGLFNPLIRRNNKIPKYW